MSGSAALRLDDDHAAELTGAVADTKAGQPGVFAAVALGYFVLAAVNLSRLFVRGRPNASQRTPFQAVGATSVVQGKVADEAERAAANVEADGVQASAKPI